MHRWKPILLCATAFLLLASFVAPSDAQVSPVRLKVTRKAKSDYRTTYQSSDGRYREREGVKAITYNVEVMNVSGGPPRDLVIKWGILVEGGSYYTMDEGGAMRKTNPLRVVSGESKVRLEFGKTHTFETDVIEIEGSETTSYGSHQRWGAKVLGYAVEVFINDQRVAADIVPSNIKGKMEKVEGRGEQKRHRF